jgi:hypothetical protein
MSTFRNVYLYVVLKKIEEILYLQLAIDGEIFLYETFIFFTQML